MNEKSILRWLVPGGIVYLAVPLLYMLFGNFTGRTVLKEIISLLTMGAFFLMLGQFYLSRINEITLKGQKMSKVVNLHKAIGYIFIPILVLHPFLIVLPRYFEGGAAPLDALTTILTTYGTKGILLGLAAMILMILLGAASMLRKKIPIKYTTWRYIHGLLSTAFVALAVWHAVDLGRHTDLFLSAYMITLSALGAALLARVYFFHPKTKGAAE